MSWLLPRVRWTVWCAAIAWLLASSAAIGALPGAGAPMQRGQSYPSPTHSWFVMPAIGGRDFVLAHVPPRMTSDSAARPSAQGIYRSVTRLAEAPEALAAWDNKVYAVFSARSDGSTEGKARNVRTLRAQRFSDSDLWVDSPAGRMDTLPSLPGAGRLAGFAAGADGPIALLSDDRNGRVRLLMLVEREWREAELPEKLIERGVDPLPPRIELFADDAGLYLLERHRDAWTVWLGTSTSSAGKGENAPPVAWTQSRIAPLGIDVADGASTVLRVDHRWFAVENAGAENLSIYEVAPEFIRRSAGIEGVGPVRAVVPLDGLARLVVISTSRPSPTPEGKPPSGVISGAKVVELSLLTGRVFFAGVAQPLDPLGSGEFRFLAIGLILAMALILVLVLRADEPEQIHLPDGFSFAEPGRRVVAAVLDAAIVALLVPRLTGNSVLELFGPMVWLDGEAFETLLVVAGLGCFVGTVGETLFGRTPGKLLADCEVISIVPQSKDAASNAEQPIPRPSFGASLMRNAIKWFLFPVAAVALMDGSGRHRGDQFGKAAVVVPIDPDAPQDDLDDDL
ncbi:MAG: hypothetical protein JNM86_01105 [Phycisphaerae bacterium]|nr:hypothetical protein [Phycisphaerae bacterium]